MPPTDDYEQDYIKSNHSKRGFYENVRLSGTCLHPYACLSVCTHIYYITALQAYGSEAVDQHNDGDSMKTRRRFQPEEGSQDRKRSGVVEGGVSVDIVAFAEPCCRCVFGSVNIQCLLLPL